MVAVALFVGFVVGALVVVVVEVVAVLFLIWKLGEKEEVRVVNSLKDDDQLQFPFPNKQGWIWILEKEKIPKTSQSTDKTLRQQKRKIEAFDVTPVKKHATIKDKSLMITEPDGTLTKVYLSGCMVEAVSAANLASRKWAKKYPVKVENKSSDIYHGSKLFYLYFETSCEKESWCINPEIGDRSVKVDGSSSKVRHFLKKLTKKTSKTAKEDKKNSENSVGGSSKLSQTEKKSNEGVEEKVIQAMIPKSVPSGSRNLGSQNSDTDSNDKMCRDDGTLCCNLLISRLFFDAKSSVDLRNLMQAHIQRMLSIARTPSFVGEIICTSVNPGVIPPYIHGMRVVPSDLKEVVAMELDIEYYGGAVLDIETRIEMQELENSDSKSVDDVTTDLLEGFEHYGEQIKLNEQTNQAVEHKDDERHKLEETKSFKGNEQTTSTLPKWKSVINSVAKQVSQVPLSLAIRVTTLRGTLRVYIKPPPSDQIWFGFTSMPDIDFSLESAVGDHKITSGHIALFIINKFKGAIRETMVLPNCESATVHFMLAEKNDWIPQQSAPFIWANPELNPEPPTEPTISHEVPCPQPPDEIHPQDVSSTTETTHNQTSSDDDEKPTENDEKTPLLESTEQNAAVVEENVGFPSSQPPSPPQAAVAEENKETADEHKLKRSGTRAKMLGFRKKMGEKLEEKRRNIEEKGRHMVEKMRGPG
ncbi:putative synaptotagmin-like mitochondrial-lipid-binding domain-containing protein [Helianthus annuus]|nr:putative synaptotagmin-like mitochondrial-lipid-binding domain-containing protein [Helianthus annuus]